MSNRRVSSKRRLSVTNDEAGKRQRSEDSHISIGRTAVAPRDGDATPPPATSTTSPTVRPQAGNERPGYASSNASSPASTVPPGSSDEGEGARTVTRPTSAPRAPRWQTDAPAPDQRLWPREQRTNPRVRDDDRDRSRDGPDPRDTVPARPSGTTRDERRSPSGGSYSGTSNIVQPPPKTQAAFVGKLYSMLEDDKIRKSGLLHWSQDGSSFVCPNPTEFSKEVLPNYFKHNNWQSFVRQLNMYSFNKVSDLYSTANADPQAWEFRHPLFRRGEPHMLANIKRKSNRTTSDTVQHPSTSQSTVSPPEDEAKPIAWAATLPASALSPPRGYSSQSRSYFVPPARPPSREYETNDQRSLRVSSNSGSSSHPSMYPSEPPAHRVDGFHHSNSRPTTSIDSVSGQIASLHDTVNRLYHTLNAERAENARTNMDLTGMLLAQNRWMLESARELRLDPGPLQRQHAELAQRYETLHAGDVLSSMTNTVRAPAPSPHEYNSRPTTSYEPPRPTSSYEPPRPSSSYDRRPPSSYDQRPTSGYGAHRPGSAYDSAPRGLPPPLGDPRDGRTLRSASSASRRPPSPAHDRRPATIDHASSYRNDHSPRAFPSQGPGYAEFRYRPPPLDPRERDSAPSRVPLHRRVTDPPVANIEDVTDSKTSLRNLLH